ncbi:hypothetical protein [Roseicitreum antarcticum]|uniref:Uncharacterized protein n=1 Tax=Roseicitreum antarcticum TaxID=564137 RepID=A0A1H2XCW0_9RHOB|nr:hypothetical protein [Roseicitreum antarcticum]SDW90667.1 hypothetical protein SAMN04488238_104150 [Roseicitreum antarcticum]
MFIILGLIVVFIVILILKPWEQRACAWREDRRALVNGVLHVCVTCGAEMALPPGKKPRRCMAQDRS